MPNAVIVAAVVSGGNFDATKNVIFIIKKAFSKIVLKGFLLYI